MRDDYYLMEPPPAEPVDACPCCGSSARVWVYAEDPTMPVTRVVMCDHSGSIGPRDALVYEGCLLQMPPDDFYRETGREAVRYWNEYAKALTAAQRANRWKTAKVLRTAGAPCTKAGADGEPCGLTPPCPDCGRACHDVPEGA